MPQVEVRILEEDFPQAGDVDHKLVELARAHWGPKIVTNDFNLNKVATVQAAQAERESAGACAEAGRASGRADARMDSREGKEANQGVAYLG